MVLYDNYRDLKLFFKEKSRTVYIYLNFFKFWNNDCHNTGLKHSKINC